jgi:signal peptidase I
MGDNRGESLDSRSFGCISENAIVGRALFRIFPLSEMGLLTTDDPYGEH